MISIWCWYWCTSCCWTWKNNYQRMWSSDSQKKTFKLKITGEREKRERVKKIEQIMHRKDINTNFSRGWKFSLFPIPLIKEIEKSKWSEKEKFAFCPHSSITIWGNGEWWKEVFFNIVCLCFFPRSWFWNFFIWVKIVYHLLARLFAFLIFLQKKTS